MTILYYELFIPFYIDSVMTHITHKLIKIMFKYIGTIVIHNN